MRYQIKTTELFDKWHDSIKDKKILTRIDIRINRVSKGNFGDYKAISENLYELRLFFGSGYRIYYTLREGEMVLLLNAGDKKSQQKDIKKAKQLMELL